ncbi:F-box domain containing protein [Tanacetum coccineum]
MTQATRNEFEELYASANEELYPGCDYFFQNVFPISKGFKLPPSYYAIKKTFKMIGLGYESIHACEHDCCLFRGDNNKDLDFCPVCNTSRWKDSNTPGKKVPKKVLRYFPIIPRLQRLYKSSHTAKDMIWHATGKCTRLTRTGPSSRGKGTRKPNLGGRGAGRLHTRDKTRNLSLKEIAEAKGPVSIQFDVGDKQTLNPLGPHAAQWSNYIGEVIRSVPLYYPSWEKVPKERKAALISNIGTLFDLRPHMESPRWTDIYEGINMHLQKAYNTNKASFKAKHWRVDPQTGTYDVEAIRQARPEEITADEWDKYIRFWNDPKNLARAAQNRQKSVVISRQGSRSLARLRDKMRQSSDTQEYPSLIDTFWRTHTVDGVFPKDEDRRIYVREDEEAGGYGVLPARATSRPSMPAPDKSLKSIHKKVNFMMSLFRSDSKYSDMFKEFESGGASGSGGCGDDEESGDDEEGEDEDGDGDS